MKISIGIFAHNEQASIRAMLVELAQQNLFSQHECEVLVLENGSRDDTAAIARKTLPNVLPKNVTAQVHELPFAGKSRTWNAFVHDLSDPTCDLLIFLDADIRFVGNQVLSEVALKLIDTPNAIVSVDQALKSTAVTNKTGMKDELSLAVSRISQQGPVAIAGSLYCGRAAVLRNYHLPYGLLVEDGFVKALVTTNDFTEDAKETRVVRADAVAHLFDPETSVRAVFQHEVRLAVGTELNIALFDYLRAESARGTQASDLIRTNNKRDPQWVAKLIAAKRKDHTLRSHAIEYALKPWLQFRRMGPSTHLKLVPIVALRVLFNAAAALTAQRSLRNGHWSW